MKAGQASRTAVMVCTGRAIGHARGQLAQFSDPTALALLPDDVRSDIERYVHGDGPKGVRGRFVTAFMEKHTQIMVARTVAVDDAIRGAPCAQLVILGAGLDGRAWRMTELAETTVFEVDHPDTQRAKRDRVGVLSQTARDVRFVPVDFTRDSLETALTQAGHDPTRPTTWIWEGVVMYLTLPQIESTLDVIARRSSPGSRLVVMYHAPSPWLTLIGAVTGRMGEPLRSTQTSDQMRSLLGRFRFRVTRDEHLGEIGARLSPALARELKPMRHARIVTADR